MNEEGEADECTYTIVTVVILIVFGALTGTDASRVAANWPTPWVGLWERINIAAFLSWIVVLAVELWRFGSARAPAVRMVRTRTNRDLGGIDVA